MGGDLSNEIILAESFECWLGHTNFNLTEEIKEKLDSYMEELGLQIYEQYKFQQAIYYSLADTAYKQIGMLAPSTA